MKKILLIATLCLLGANLALAQTQPVFSSALGGGSTYTTRGVRKTMYRPTKTYTAAKRKATSVKRTTIKYAPGQLDLTKAQTEKLAPFIKRLQRGEVKSVKLVATVRNYNTSYRRLTNLSKVVLAYSPNLKIDFQHITGRAVLDSNDNTVEIIEYR